MFPALVLTTLFQAAPLTPMPLGRYEGVALVHGAKVYLIGGTSARSSQEGRVDIYDTTRNTWSTAKPLPTPRTFLCGTELDGKLYVIGGTGEHGRTRVVERYDPTTDRWERLTDLNTSRTHVAAVAFQGKIYVLGGFLGKEEEGRTGTRSVEVYDPATNRWSNGPPLPLGLHGHVAVVLGGKIHVLGDDDFHFALEGQEWKPRARHPVGLFAEGAVVDGKLYVTGGSSADFRPTWRYEPRTDRWTRGADSPTPRYHFQLATVGDKIYTFGGVKVTDGPGPRCLSKVDCYDPAKNRWRE